MSDESSPCLPPSESDYIRNESDFKFSFMSKADFESILKQVRRERKKKVEEREWKKYLARKKEKKTEMMDDEVKVSIATSTDDFNSALRSKTLAFAPFETLISPVSSFKSEHLKTCRQLMEKPGKSTAQLAQTDCLPEQPKSPLKPDMSEGLVTKSDIELKRVDELRAKMLVAMKGIDSALDWDGQGIEEEDLLRNRQRAAEFAARFKRNYHYQICCQVNELKKHLTADGPKRPKPSLIVHKLFSCHQAGLQGLQAIEKHLRGTVNEGPLFWLKEYVASICELSGLLSKHNGNDDLDKLDDLEKSCIQMIDRIHELTQKKQKALEINKKVKKTVGKKTGGVKATPDNLWMYRTHRTWKEKATELARARLTKKNKRKQEIKQSKNQKQDPKRTGPPIMPELKLANHRMEVRQREGAVFRRQNRYVTEEQIRTMMEIIPEVTDSECEGENKENSCDLDHQMNEIKSQSPKEIKETETRMPLLQEIMDCNVAVAVPSKQPEERENVKLIVMKRINDDDPSEESPPPSVPPQKFVSKRHADIAEAYRKSVRDYQTASEWYRNDVVTVIEKMTNCITDDLIHEVYNEVNVTQIVEKMIDIELKPMPCSQ